MRVTRCIACGLSLVFAAHGAIAETELVVEQASGALPLAGERRLHIEGVRGIVRVKGLEDGVEGEIRFLSTVPNDPERELAVVLATDGSTLKLRAPEGAEDLARDLWVAVPPGMSVRVQVSNTTLVVADVRADVEGSGAKLDVLARRMWGRLALEVEGGTVEATSHEGDVVLSGREIDAELGDVVGDVELSLESSQLRATGIDGFVDATLRGGSARLGKIMSGLRLDAADGEIEIVELEGSGELILAQAPLSIQDSAASLSIETDAEVRFRDLEGPSVQIEGYGATVRGVGSTGVLGVRTHDASVILEAIEGDLRIEGDGLSVDVKQVEGNVELALTDSGVEIEGVKGELRVTNDVGRVTVRGAESTVAVELAYGDVKIEGARGSVEIEVEQGNVEVGWVGAPRGADSRIRTGSGDIDVHLPPGATAGLDARAAGGQIRSDHPDVRVADDGRSAVGTVRRGGVGRLKIDCGGNLYLGSSGAR